MERIGKCLCNCIAVGQRKNTFSAVFYLSTSDLKKVFLSKHYVLAWLKVTVVA